MIPIPYAMDYSSSVGGATLKVVRCSECETEYVYELRREATGQGTSFLFLDGDGAAARASARAAEKLRRKLERGIDLVPCPACGRYQDDMLPKARREYRTWMFTAGVLVILGVLPVALFGGIINDASRQRGPMIAWPIFVSGLAALLMLGIGLMIARFMLARGYDPNNQDVEARKKLGQSRAVMRAEFEKMVKAQLLLPERQRSSIRAEFEKMVKAQREKQLDSEGAGTETERARI